MLLRRFVLLIFAFNSGFAGATWWCNHWLTSYQVQQIQVQQYYWAEYQRQEAQRKEAARLAVSWLEVPEQRGAAEFDDDYSFLKAQRDLERRGVVASTILEPEAVSPYYRYQFRTRVYYSATSKPDLAGRIPIVDSEARALVVIMSGAGTENSGGETATYTANKWASLGYSVLSFDPPFHKDGGTNPNFKDGNNYVQWVYSLLQKLKNSGQELILIGHSFGSKVILELLQRDPSLSNKVIISSPGPIDQYSMSYFQNHVAKTLKEKEGIRVNSSGSDFVRSVSDKFITSQDRYYANYYGYYVDVTSYYDPTVLNPNLQMDFVVGENDEFIPPGYDYVGAFQSKYSRSRVQIIKGGGHVIWKAKDEDGSDVMTKYLLQLSQLDIKDQNKIKKDWFEKKQPLPVDRLARLYHLNPYFKFWFDQNFGASTLLALLENSDQAKAQEIEGRFQEQIEARKRQIFENIKKDAAFCASHAELISQMGTKRFQPNQLLAAYFTYLEKRKSHLSG